MLQYIKKCDFLYSEAKFTFNEKGDTGYKTIFGGIISIITIFASIGATLYFISRLLNKEDSSVILSTETDFYVNITYSHLLPFMVRFSDSYSVPYTNQTSRLYNVYLRLWFGGTNDSNSEESSQQYYDLINVSKCNINQHFGEYKQYFENDPDLDTYYCPDLRQFNQTIYGIYGGYKPYSYLHFYFAKCLNSTMNNTCFEEDYINKKLSGTYLDVKFIGYKMDSLKEKVSTIEIKSERFLVSNSVYKRIWMYIRKIRYITDNGIVFSSKKEETFHLYENVRSDTDIRDTNSGSVPGAFLTLSILNNGEVSIYNRKYQKIQDYIATIGGIIKALTILGTILNYFNSINSYYFFIIRDFMISNHIAQLEKSVSNNFPSQISQMSQVSQKSKLSQISRISQMEKLYNNNKSASSSNRAFNTNSQFVNKSKSRFFPNFNKVKSNNQNNKMLKKDEMRERILYSKFSSAFCPPAFFGTNKKERAKNFWYFQNINIRLNLINVLNLLKKIDDIDYSFRMNNVFINEKSNIPGLIHIMNKYEDKNNKNSEKDNPLISHRSELGINNN